MIWIVAFLLLIISALVVVVAFQAKKLAFRKWLILELTAKLFPFPQDLLDKAKSARKSELQ